MWPGHHCTETCPHIRPGDQSLPTCVALETAVATHGKLFRPNRTVRSRRFYFNNPQGSMDVSKYEKC